MIVDVLVPSNATEKSPEPPARAEVVDSKPLARGARADRSAKRLAAVGVTLNDALARVPRARCELPERSALLELSNLGLHTKASLTPAAAAPLHAEGVRLGVVGRDDEIAQARR